jgi:hypothetical protein
MSRQFYPHSFNHTNNIRWNVQIMEQLSMQFLPLCHSSVLSPNIHEFSSQVLFIYNGLEQRFPNWWVASRFVVGRKKFLKWDFKYIQIKTHKEWESKKIEKGKKISHITKLETDKNKANNSHWSGRQCRHQQ